MGWLRAAGDQADRDPAVDADSGVAASYGLSAKSPDDLVRRLAALYYGVCWPAGLVVAVASDDPLFVDRRL